MAVWTIDLQGRFGEIAERSLSVLTEERVVTVAADYVETDYIPALFNEHHGIPAWKAPKLRAGDPLLDSGGLSSAWVTTISGSTAEVGSSTPYAHVQSEGATIRAKNPSGLLWIPNPAVMGNSQRRTMTTKEAIAKFGLFRPWKKGGKERAAILRDKDGKVYYFGVPEVTIPPHPIMAGIPNQVFDEGMRMSLDALVADAWEGANASA